MGTLQFFYKRKEGVRSQKCLKGETMPLYEEKGPQKEKIGPQQGEQMFFDFPGRWDEHPLLPSMWASIALTKVESIVYQTTN